MNYTRLRILELDGTEAFDTGGDELIVLPLSGSCDVAIDGEAFELEGRESVFSAVTDFAYAPRDAHVDGHRRRAASRFPPRRAQRRLPARYGAAEDVPGRAARRRQREPPGQQLRVRRGVRVRRADRRRGAHAERQLVLVSAAPPRRPRGDLLLRDLRRRLRLPARLRRDRRAAGGALRRPDRPAVRLPRPVDGAARLRHVLPERDGRDRARVELRRRPRRTRGSEEPGRIRRSIRDCR